MNGYQEKLLERIQAKYNISEQAVLAYKKCPRHKFIHKNFSMEEMYQDYPLTIFESDEYISTISQPSFVLLMLDMLDLTPSSKVLEIGAGSGWNAALMSTMADKVVSIEIIPEIAKETRENISNLGFQNVTVVLGDGSHGFLPEAPYDRGIFTAGATDLPKSFHEQIEVGGKLLFVLKTSSVDLLLLLEKKEDHFIERKRIHCSFVPMRGDKEAVLDEGLDRLVNSKKPLKIWLNPDPGGKDSVISDSYEEDGDFQFESHLP
jgi:protein-L-isoaspartate(D-aspartate) O-methyltransferase